MANATADLDEIRSYSDGGKALTEWLATARQAGTSAQNQEVKPVTPGFRAGWLLVRGVLRGLADSFFAALEFLLGEGAHCGVGAAEGVHLGKELGEGGRVYLWNLLKGVLPESGGCERLTGLFN